MWNCHMASHLKSFRSQGSSRYVNVLQTYLSNLPEYLFSNCCWRHHSSSLLDFLNVFFQICLDVIFVFPYIWKLEFVKIMQFFGFYLKILNIILNWILNIILNGIIQIWVCPFMRILYMPKKMVENQTIYALGDPHHWFWGLVDLGKWMNWEM